MLPRLLAVTAVAVALLLVGAGAASADRPEGWGESYDVSMTHTLLVLAGIPLLCIVVLTLAVYLPSIVRGESVSPAGARASEEWFGGRRDAQQSVHHALEQRKPEVTDETGGASGSW